MQFRLHGKLKFVFIDIWINNLNYRWFLHGIRELSCNTQSPMQKYYKLAREKIKKTESQNTRQSIRSNEFIECRNLMEVTDPTSQSNTCSFCHFFNKHIFRQRLHYF